MKRLVLLACALGIACGEAGAPTPTAPAPNAYPLPAGAPTDAAAPAGTTRITITTIEVIGPDQVRVTPDKLKVIARPTPSSSYKMRVWIFCPPGLEGPQGSGWNRETVEYLITTRDLPTGFGATFSSDLRLDGGYTVVEKALSMQQPGQQRITTEIFRNRAVIVRNEFVATFSE